MPIFNLIPSPQKVLNKRRSERKKSKRLKKFTKQVSLPKVVKSPSWMDVTQRLLGDVTNMNINPNNARFQQRAVS